MSKNIKNKESKGLSEKHIQPFFLFFFLVLKFDRARIHKGNITLKDLTNYKVKVRNTLNISS